MTHRETRTRIAYTPPMASAARRPTIRAGRGLRNEPDTVVWVDFCTPSMEQLHELDGELGLHERALEDALGPLQRPKLDHYAAPVPVFPRRVRRRRTGTPGRDRDRRRSSTEGWLIAVRKGRRVRACAPTVGPLPPPRRAGRELLALRAARRRRRRLLRRRPSLRRLLRRRGRQHLLRATQPCEQRHRFDMRRALFASTARRPTREAVSSLMRREHAAVSRTCTPTSKTSTTTSANQRVLRPAPRPGQHDRRDQSQPARLPEEPDRQGHQRGRHHRRARPRDRLLRHERPLPRVRQSPGVCVSAALVVVMSGGLYLRSSDPGPAMSDRFAVAGTFLVKYTAAYRQPAASHANALDQPKHRRRRAASTSAATERDVTPTTPSIVTTRPASPEPTVLVRSGRGVGTRAYRTFLRRARRNARASC